MKVKRYHQIFEIDNCNEHLNNVQFLHYIQHQIAMAVSIKISDRSVASEENPDGAGYSSLCTAEFTNIALQTFTNTKKVRVDIFSFKEWDWEKVKQLLAAAFATKNSAVKNKEVQWG